MKISVIVAFGGLVVPLTTHAQTTSTPQSWSCIVTEEKLDGTWVATRTLVQTNGAIAPTRDTYDWEPKERSQFGPNTSFRWDLNYVWPNTLPNQTAIPLTDIMVGLHFRIEPQTRPPDLRNPQRSWLHLYRLSNPDQAQSSTSASLISPLFWNQFPNGTQSAKSVLSLDDLMAFGTGLNGLVWNMRSAPNEFGGTSVLAKGSFSIATLRGKPQEILRLRRLLNQKAANFRSNCSTSPTPSVSMN